VSENDTKAAFLLSNEDKETGFSMAHDSCHNITLLREGSPVAWFSAAVNEDVLRAFLKLIRDREGNIKGCMKT